MSHLLSSQVKPQTSQRENLLRSHKMVSLNVISRSRMCLNLDFDKAKPSSPKITQCQNQVYNVSSNVVITYALPSRRSHVIQPSRFLVEGLSRTTIGSTAVFRR